jgi:hypothetical protein
MGSQGSGSGVQEKTVVEGGSLLAHSSIQGENEYDMAIALVVFLNPEPRTLISIPLRSE